MAEKRTPPRYISEVLSPRKRAEWRKLFARLSKSELKAIGIELSLAAQRGDTDSEKEIANAHCDPKLVVRVIRTQGEKRKLQTIYCSPNRCGQCPHGPYWYVFRVSKKRNEITVRFAGQPALDENTLEQMRKDVEAATPVALKIEHSTPLGRAFPAD